MATHTWKGQIYDRAVQVGPDDGPRYETTYHSIPGVDGLISVLQGFRGHTIALAGEYRAGSLTDCMTWLAAQQALVGGCLDTLSLYSGARTLQYCELKGFRMLGLRPAEGGGHAIRWLAAWLQVHPNDEF